MMRHNKAILANMNHQGTPVVIDDKRGVASFASTFGTTLDYFQKNEEIMRHQKKILAKINHQGTPVVIDDKRGVALFASAFGTTLESRTFAFSRLRVSSVL